MTLLTPFWLSSDTGQWYQMKVRVVSDTPGPNYITAAGMLYSGIFPILRISVPRDIYRCQPVIPI